MSQKLRIQSKIKADAHIREQLQSQVAVTTIGVFREEATELNVKSSCIQRLQCADRT